MKVINSLTVTEKNGFLPSCYVSWSFNYFMYLTSGFFSGHGRIIQKSFFYLHRNKERDAFVLRDVCYEILDSINDPRKVFLSTLFFFSNTTCSYIRLVERFRNEKVLLHVFDYVFELIYLYLF